MAFWNFEIYKFSFLCIMNLPYGSYHSMFKSEN